MVSKESVSDTRNEYDRKTVSIHIVGVKTTTHYKKVCFYFVSSNIIRIFAHRMKLNQLKSLLV